MTSIISPWASATQLATKAQGSLATASSMLRSVVPRPTDPQHGGGYVGSEARHGGGFIPPYVPNNGAARLASAAITDIQQALGLGANLSTGVRTAFSSALSAATDGVHLLTAATMSPAVLNVVPLRFDAASMWLGLAKNLLSLEYGGSAKPPVMEPIMIQLPSPDSPIQ